MELDNTVLEGQSMNVMAEKLAGLKVLFPEVFTEDKIDFKRLRDVLGDLVAYTNEHYELTWAGKAEARKEVQRQSVATLVPDMESSIGFDHSENILIEGENLEALRVLQKSYFGKVKMIYIDPPYNTGNDTFVYPDDFSQRREAYEKEVGVRDESGFLNKQDLWKKNSKENGQFHSVWLSMMYPRLYLSRNLLREDGVIFVSIDDNEKANLKLLMDEIFGEENFYGCFVWQRRSGAMDSVDNVSVDHEYVLCYGKAKTKLKGIKRTFDKYSNPDNDPRGEWIADNLSAGKVGGDVYYPVINPENGIHYFPPKGRYWPYNRETMARKIEEGRIIFPKNPNGVPLLKRFKDEAKSLFLPVSTWMRNDEKKIASNSLKAAFNTEGTREMQELFGDKLFSHPKPTTLIKSLASQCLDDNDIILDFFAGSGTTAQAILELNEQLGKNLKFICIQGPEAIEMTETAYKKGYEKVSDITKARISKVIENIDSDSKLNFQNHKFGFRSFTLKKSNFKVWNNYLRDNNLFSQLKVFCNQIDNIEPGHALIFELILKMGLPLSIQCVYNKDYDLFEVGDNMMLASFSKLESYHIDYILFKKPRKFICMDVSFNGNDQLLTNTKLQFNEAEIPFQVI